MESKCIMCDRQLSDYCINNQTTELSNSIYNQTCGEACRGKFYRDKREKNMILESINKNNQDQIKRFTVKKIIELGFKVNLTLQ